MIDRQVEKQHWAGGMLIFEVLILLKIAGEQKKQRWVVCGLQGVGTELSRHRESCWRKNDSLMPVPVLALFLWYCITVTDKSLTKPRLLESRSLLSYPILVRGLSLGTATSLLCDYEQVPCPLWALGSSKRAGPRDPWRWVT